MCVQYSTWDGGRADCLYCVCMCVCDTAYGILCGSKYWCVFCVHVCAITLFILEQSVVSNTVFVLMSCVDQIAVCVILSIIILQCVDVAGMIDWLTD